MRLEPGTSELRGVERCLLYLCILDRYEYSICDRYIRCQLEVFMHKRKAAPAQACQTASRRGVKGMAYYGVGYTLFWKTGTEKATSHVFFVDWGPFSAGGTGSVLESTKTAESNQKMPTISASHPPHHITQQDVWLSERVRTPSE